MVFIILYIILKLLLDITIWNILHYKNQILNMMDLQFCIQDLENNIFLCLKIVKIDLGFKHTTCKFEKYFFSKF